MADEYQVSSIDQEPVWAAEKEALLHNPLYTDVAEQKASNERAADHEILQFLRSIGVANPQIMRRFILAVMEKNATEKDLIWVYQMKDLKLNGTLDRATFVQITRQQLQGNTQLTITRDYEEVAKCYAWNGDDGCVRYVNLCNDIHAWRVGRMRLVEYPLKQLYPPYRYPQSEKYPKPPQGEWQVDKKRREPHELPTMTPEELSAVPAIVRSIAKALLEHRKYPNITKAFFVLEKQKEDKSIQTGVVPSNCAQKVLDDWLPFRLDTRQMEILRLYYEHPFVLHFFRYRDFLLDVKFEMGELDSVYRETPDETRKLAILAKIKKHVFNTGLLMADPFKDHDVLKQDGLSRSKMKRAFHLLNVGYGLRCDISCSDLDFVFNCYQRTDELIDYKRLLNDLEEAFVERFHPGGRLSLIMDSFEENLIRGPFYNAATGFITQSEILNNPGSPEELLKAAINRLRMLVAERNIAVEQIFKVFDVQKFRCIQNILQIPRILQLCNLPVTAQEAHVIMAKYSDSKGFRYLEFLKDIDPISNPEILPTYPITLATTEQWKHKRLWYPEVIPQNAFQDYQGPEAILEKCRKHVYMNRLRVCDFFRDYDRLNHGRITRKQFRRCTAMMQLRLSPIENLILENRYACEDDLEFLKYPNFVADMDHVYGAKDIGDRPSVIPERYCFAKECDRFELDEKEIHLAQEGFRKIAEKILELRCHIAPYFQDFDALRSGGITPSRFRRMINNLGLDVISEVEWKALLKYFSRRGKPVFDYRQFLAKVEEIGRLREREAAVEPRLTLIRPMTDVNPEYLNGTTPQWSQS